MTLLSDIDSMAHIVNQLIDTAEAETLSLRPGEIADIQAVCVDVAVFLAPIALSEQKAIAVQGETCPVWVAGNAGALFQALRNLVENAIRHTPRDSAVEITVNADGRVAVCDSGPGILPEQRELVFQRFWRGDRRRAGSAGLGLSIVARIVSAHGGRITIGAAPSGGAMVSIGMRLASAPADTVLHRGGARGDY